MYGKREQDPNETVHYRSDRLILVNGEFFFATRENTEEGPFHTREDAVNFIDAYITRMQNHA